MNRRQVLFGAAATAVAFRGFVPWASAQTPGGSAVSMSVTFEPFTLGIRGTYTLNGAVTALVGVIPPIVSGGLSSGAARGVIEGAIVPGANTTAPAIPVAPSVPAPGPIPTASAAPLRPAMMSIVRVPRASAGQGSQAAH